MSDPVVVTVLDAEPVTVARGATETVTVAVDAPEPILVEVEGAAPMRVEVGAGDTIQVDVTTLGAPGVPGAQGPSGSGILVTAGATLLALQAVRIDADEIAYPVTSLDEEWIEAVAGVVLTGALAGETVALRAAGAIDNAAATNPIGPLFLGEDGLLTTNPDTGMAQVRMGYGYAPNLLAVRIMTPIYHEET